MRRLRQVLALLLLLLHVQPSQTLAAGTLVYQGGVITGPGTGDVVGPASSVDNGIVRYDGTTGKLVQGYTSNTPTCGDTGICTFVAPILGTPTSGVATNLTGLPLTTGVTGILPSANGGTGNGFTKFSGPTTAEKTFTLPDASATLLYSGGALGTPSSGTLTNATGLPLSSGVTGILPTANGGTGIAYFTAAGPTVARIYTFPDAAATVLTTNAAVTVAQGGTGLTTLTANNVILGNGTSTPSFVAPGTSGNVLTSNGTTWTSAAAGGSSPLTTKGDLYGFTTVNARVPIGTNGARLTADSGSSSGLSWLLPATNTVATSESTTSTSYTDLTTSGPAVTVTVGASGTAMVIITAKITVPGSTAITAMSFAVSGASTVSASDARALFIDRSSENQRSSTVMFLTGLTAGSNTFTAKYRSTLGNTGTFADRDITVIPF